MLSVLGFLVILAPLVIVHEFGHFFFARLFNVRAEVFSVGFGPKIWSRMFGETDFRVSLIPLGGYVKLLGEDCEAHLSEAEKKRALHHQTKWKRFFIFFGGPFFNFIFAILIYMAILAIGEPQVASVAGRVVPGSAAARAGFQSGDQILKIDGKPVKTFSEVITAVADKPETQVEFAVKHPGQTQEVLLQAMTEKEPGYTIYGEHKEVGRLEGLFPAPRSNRAGVSHPASLAGKAGIATQSEITSFNGKEISDWEALETAYSQAHVGESIRLGVRSVEGKAFAAEFKKVKAQGTLADLGLYSSELFVEKTIPKSPAEAAGLQKGDRVISISGQLIPSFFSMKDSIQEFAQKDGNIELVWERNGVLMKKILQPASTTERDATLKKTTHFTIGLVPMLSMNEPTLLVHRVWNPVMLVWEGTTRMITLSWRNLVSLSKMFTGDVSVGTLGGPILIGKIAGDSLARGLISFLSTMAVLSVGLGILNILPVPVLDGGHILLLGLEAIRGKRLSMRQMEIVQQVGLTLVLLLMFVVLTNDIRRLSFFN